MYLLVVNFLSHSIFDLNYMIVVHLCVVSRLLAVCFPLVSD